MGAPSSFIVPGHNRGIALGDSVLMHQLPEVRRVDAVRARRAEQALATMVAEVRAGLLRRPLPELPCKYFYDERGSELFEEITQLPEYYPTRTETRILAVHAAEIVETVKPV